MKISPQKTSFFYEFGEWVLNISPVFIIAEEKIAYAKK
jgi:hypothetical protein